jgi:hypothetical protein
MCFMNVIQIQMYVAGLRASRLTDAELPICFLGLKSQAETSPLLAHFIHTARNGDDQTA